MGRQMTYQAMAEERIMGGVIAPDAAVAKAHAIYTPLTLSLYDGLVHGLSNRFAWRCPTQALLRLYSANLSSNHLEAGVGTGSLIDRAGKVDFQRLVLLDINRNCLAAAQRRLARFRPQIREASLFDPLPGEFGLFESIGLTYVLHCLPGRLPEKLSVLDRLRPLMAERGVLFGATILGRGVEANGAARALFRLYNRKGVFNNLEDDGEALEAGLRQRFADVEVERKGCVALFRVGSPRKL
jgi:hypothetical protein